MQWIIILENLRSAYNVGTIIRTADVLGFSVWCVGYTPSPFFDNKVAKTSLWAENHVSIKHFKTMQECKNALDKTYVLIAAEITSDSIWLQDFVNIQKEKNQTEIAVVFGNEVSGVEDETLKMVDCVVHIPMIWHKESLNVAQTAAIFMWACRSDEAPPRPE